MCGLTYAAVIFGTEFAFTAGVLVKVSTVGSVHRLKIALQVLVGFHNCNLKRLKCIAKPEFSVVCW